MAAHAARLARLFTPEYARRINAQIVHPAESRVVKPNELESALSQPVNVSIYEPHRTAPYLAATLAFGIIKGHPFMDGNKRTGILQSTSTTKLFT
jgi:prophage maintenance system killer protein